MSGNLDGPASIDELGGVSASCARFRTAVAYDRLPRSTEILVDEKDERDAARVRGCELLSLAEPAWNPLTPAFTGLVACLIIAVVA